MDDDQTTENNSNIVQHRKGIGCTPNMESQRADARKQGPHQPSDDLRDHMLILKKASKASQHRSTCTGKDDLHTAANDANIGYRQEEIQPMRDQSSKGALACKKTGRPHNGNIGRRRGKRVL